MSAIYASSPGVKPNGLGYEAKSQTMRQPIEQAGSSPLEQIAERSMVSPKGPDGLASPHQKEPDYDVMHRRMWIVQD